MNNHKTDVLVIGSGLSGASAALSAAEAGMAVTLITRASDTINSNTNEAQGGIIYRGRNDSEKLLVRDLVKCGGEVTNVEAAKKLANLGPELVKSLLIQKLKINFAKNGNGVLFTKEAAHSVPRIIYKADQTGHEIETKIIEKLRKFKNINILNDNVAVDLITLSHHSKKASDMYFTPTCVGAYVLDNKKKHVYPILAKETILATGGLGRIFLHTSNPIGSRGDGIAMAFRAGVRVINLEYIQFHPTTFYSPESERFLISETMRGNGAKLINGSGKRFMQNYHRLVELAPRDIVSISIHEEMLKEKSNCVYLDISFKNSDWIKNRFPKIYNECLRHGIDITRQPIPVVPAAHYSCGGIHTDLNAQTSMKNLRAAGEVACNGLHGANRLASSSLLECLTFGTIAGKEAAKRIKKEKFYFPPIDLWKYETEKVDRALVHQDWLTIKHTMWNYVGLVRNTKRLSRAKDIMHELNNEIERFYAHAQLSDEIIGLRNASMVSRLVINAAMQNRKSLGCHFRVD